MKTTKKIIALALALTTLFAVGCSKKTGDTQNDKNQNDNQDSAGINSENGGIKNEHIELSEGDVVFRGKVTSLDNKSYIEMEIVDSEIAFGIYHVLVSDQTEYYDQNGKKSARSDINSITFIPIKLGSSK